MKGCKDNSIKQNPHGNVRYSKILTRGTDPFNQYRENQSTGYDTINQVNPTFFSSIFVDDKVLLHKP